MSAQKPPLSGAGRRPSLPQERIARLSLQLLMLAITAAIVSAAAHADEATDPVAGNNIPGRQFVARGHRAHAVPGQRLAHGQDWWVRGNGCSPDNTQLLTNGDTFSIVTAGFHVDLPLGDHTNGLDHEIACTINLRLKPPEGMMFSGLEQVLSGGVLKSSRSRVALRANYSVGPRGYRADPLIYAFGDPVAASDTDSVFTITLQDLNLPRIVQCREEVRYRMRMTLNATRASAQTEFVDAGVDSLDGQFVTNVRPVYVPCR